MEHAFVTAMAGGWHSGCVDDGSESGQHAGAFDENVLVVVVTDCLFWNATYSTGGTSDFGHWVCERNSPSTPRGRRLRHR